MALFEETEPPSSGEAEKIKICSRSTTKNKNQLSKKFELLVLTNFSNYLRQSFKHLYGIFSESFKRFRVLSIGIYLPHVALLSICLIVVISNVNDKIIAHAYADNLVEVEPDTEMGVVQNVDSYTPLIKRDDLSLEHSITALSDGFAANSGTVETVITAREEPLPDNSKGDVAYIIRNGDTLSSLGVKFDVKIATLKYLNNIDNINALKPDSQIKVPKKGYEVPASLIAKKENDKRVTLALAERNTVARSQASTRGATVNQTPGSKSNGYPYGYCTYYVATRRMVPTSWGDAKAWLNSARRAGYTTGDSPAAGAIVVTSESWWGHVAYVESVDGNEITLSEMNYKGWGVTSRRTISVDSRVIRGFIY